MKQFEVWVECSDKCPVRHKEPMSYGTFDEGRAQRLVNMMSDDLHNARMEEVVHA